MNTKIINVVEVFINDIDFLKCQEYFRFFAIDYALISQTLELITSLVVVLRLFLW